METSRRLLYPQFGGKWWSAITGIAILALLNAPTAVMVYGIFTGWNTLDSLALVLLAVFMGLYGIYALRMWRNGWWLGALLWPYAIFQEFILFLLSIYSYYTGTVTWKGRNVTVAKAQVAKKL